MFICYFPLLNKMLYFVSLQKQYHNINPLVILPNMSMATSYIFEMRSELTGAFREENIRKIKDSFVIALVVGLWKWHVRHFSRVYFWKDGYWGGYTILCTVLLLPFGLSVIKEERVKRSQLKASVFSQRKKKLFFFFTTAILQRTEELFLKPEVWWCPALKCLDTRTALNLDRSHVYTYKFDWQAFSLTYRNLINV